MLAWQALDRLSISLAPLSPHIGLLDREHININSTRGTIIASVWNFTITKHSSAFQKLNSYVPLAPASLARKDLFYCLLNS